MVPLCANDKCTHSLTIYGCISIYWCQTKLCVSREENEEEAGPTSPPLRIKWMSFLHTYTLNKHNKSNSEEDKTNRQVGTVAAGLLQGFKDPNQFQHFRGKYSKEDGWHRLAANTQINNIHSIEEKNMVCESFLLNGSESRGSEKQLVCPPLYSRERKIEYGLAWGKEKRNLPLLTLWNKIEHRDMMR